MKPMEEVNAHVHTLRDPRPSGPATRGHGDRALPLADLHGPADAGCAATVVRAAVCGHRIPAGDSGRGSASGGGLFQGDVLPADGPALPAGVGHAGGGVRLRPGRHPAFWRLERLGLDRRFRLCSGERHRPGTVLPLGLAAGHPGQVQETGHAGPGSACGSVRAVAHRPALPGDSGADRGSHHAGALSFRPGVGLAGEQRQDRGVGDDPAQPDLGRGRAIQLRALMGKHSGSSFPSAPRRHGSPIKCFALNSKCEYNVQHPASLNSGSCGGSGLHESLFVSPLS